MTPGSYRLILEPANSRHAWQGAPHSPLSFRAESPVVTVVAIVANAGVAR
jgi:hypothetical protein